MAFKPIKYCSSSEFTTIGLVIKPDASAKAASFHSTFAGEVGSKTIR